MIFGVRWKSNETFKFEWIMGLKKLVILKRIFEFIQEARLFNSAYIFKWKTIFTLITMTYLFLMMKSMGMVTESHPQATAIRNEKAGQVGNISYNPFLHINPIRICAGTCHFGIPLWTAWPTDDNVPLPHNQYDQCVDESRQMWRGW